MTSLNKFGITEVQMLAIAGKHDVAYTFGKGSMARILAYSQELLALAAPAVANAAPAGHLTDAQLDAIRKQTYKVDVPEGDYRYGEQVRQSQFAFARAAVAAAGPDAALVASLREILAALTHDDDEGLIEHSESVKRARALLAAADNPK